MIKHLPVDLGYSDLAANTGKSGRVYSTPDGTKYPSITTVLSHLSAQAIQEWRARVGEKEANRVSRVAASRGTTVHDLMEKYIAGEKIQTSKLMPHHAKSYHSLRRIVDERLSEVYAQEAPLYSDFLGVAGRVDLVGRFDGVRSIVDFKTSSKPKKKEWISNYFMQACAYAIMWEERTGMPIVNVVIIMDIDGHEPEVFIEHRDNWDKELIKTIKEYHRLERCKPI